MWKKTGKGRKGCIFPSLIDKKKNKDRQEREKKA